MAATDDKDISLKNITRCPECNLIISLSIYYKEITLYVIYYCENNHKGEISLEQYLQMYNNYSLTKEKCLKCNTIQSEVNAIFLFVANVINSYVIHVLLIILIMTGFIILIILTGMMHYVNYILIIMHFIVINAKKTYAFIASKSMIHMIL